MLYFGNILEKDVKFKVMNTCLKNISQDLMKVEISSTLHFKEGVYKGFTKYTKGERIISVCRDKFTILDVWKDQMWWYVKYHSQHEIGFVFTSNRGIVAKKRLRWAKIKLPLWVILSSIFLGQIYLEIVFLEIIYLKGLNFTISSYSSTLHSQKSNTLKFTWWFREHQSSH